VWGLAFAQCMEFERRWQASLGAVIGNNEFGLRFYAGSWM